MRGCFGAKKLIRPLYIRGQSIKLHFYKNASFEINSMFARKNILDLWLLRIESRCYLFGCSKVLL